MRTATPPPAAVYPPPAPDAPATGGPGFPLLLATVSAADTRPATRVVLALAAERGAVPHVLRVHDVPAMDVAALGMPAYPGDIFSAGAPFAPVSQAEDVDRVSAELDAVGVSPAAPWPVRVEVGAPGECIVREAARVGAALIVLGLRPHGLVDRTLGDDTTLHVMRHASCSVLGVADGRTEHGGTEVGSADVSASGTRPALAGLPRRVLVGVDFTRASTRAAYAALALVADGGTLVLAHVVAPSGAADPDQSDEGAALVHVLGVDGAFARLVTELTAAVPAGRAAGFDCAVVPGVPGQSVAGALLDAADRAGADLVAVATQRLPRLERFFLGSVTTDLARAGRHPLLVVPPDAPDAPRA